MPTELPFGEWLPDQAEIDTGVTNEALNVFPGANSYEPLPKADAFSDEMETDAVPCGCASVNLTTGDFRIIAGSQDKLWLQSGTTWDDISGSDAPYSATEDERWSFAQWGELALACNINDPLQQVDLDAGTDATTVSGSPPQARFVGVIGEYVFLAGLEDDEKAIAWSGTGNHASWTPGTDNSDLQEFKDGGRVMNFSASAGLVIQERMLRQVIRTPGAATGAWGFQEVTTAKGAIAPFSVVKFGPRIAYLTEDGFVMADGVGNVEPIGAGKIDKWFLGQVTQDRLYSVLGTYHPIRPYFIWIFKSGAEEYYDKGLVYNWVARRFSRFDATAFPDIGGLWDIAGLATPGLTLDDLDGLYADADVSIPYPSDSRVWLGGRPALAGLGAEGVLVFFEGGNAPATIISGERQLIPGSRAVVNGVWPEIDTTDCAVSVKVRETLAGSATTKGPASVQASGRAPLRAGGRLHRFQLAIDEDATWTHATGFRDIDARRQGMR